MIVLYDNPFSPFARKVRMALGFKEFPYESIDALALTEHERLHTVNRRAEVPVLVEGSVTVVDSADIVAYLEDRFPTPPLLPPAPALRATARHWQRVADTVLDAIIHDISLWTWPTHNRPDAAPTGLLEAGQRDLEIVLAELDRALGSNDFLCGTLSVADIALFPHLSSLKVLGIPMEPFPNVRRWNANMRTLPCVRSDLDYVRQSAIAKFAPGASPYEAEKFVWRGDRIEWLLAHGFREWFWSELASGRAVVPRSV